MMASLSARNLGGSHVTLSHPETASRAPPKAFSLRIAGRCRVVAPSTSSVAARLTEVPRTMHTYSEQSLSVSHDELEDWISGSVNEIVRNLRQAPLFVHVYSNGGLDGDVSFVTEKSVKEEDWERAKGQWEKGEKAMPEGVIFVEELEDDKEEEEEEIGGSAARLWGLVVQGRGGKRGPPVCYLLKTSRVGSGTGIWSTHFCLVTVNGFRESARSQLMNFWLCDGWGTSIAGRKNGRVQSGNGVY